MKASKTNRALSLLLSLTMCAMLVPAPAFATDTTDTTGTSTESTTQTENTNTGSDGTSTSDTTQSDTTQSSATDTKTTETAPAEETKSSNDTTTSTDETTSDDEQAEEAEAVASLGTTNYASIAEAIEAAAKSSSSYKEIKLLKSTTESVTIPAGKCITLNLQNFTLTNEAGKHTVTNNGKLRIWSEGTIDNVSNGCAAIENAQGATCELRYVTIDRSQETGKSKDVSGGNSYYYIENFGTMTIGYANNPAASGITVKSDGKFSSLVHNGWYEGKDNTSGKTATMTIICGTFVGGVNTIKNDDYGKLTIKGGTFENSTQAAVFNVNDATISGGTFTSTADSAVYTKAYNTGYNTGTTTITGGTFSSVADSDFYLESHDLDPKIVVSGGTFSKALKAEYCAENYEPGTNADGTYCAAGTLAAIGEKTYGSLADAFSAAQSGDTVVLKKDVDLGSGKLSDNQKATNVTVDLGGHKITSSGSYTLAVGASGWTFQNGTIENTASSSGYGAVYCYAATSNAVFKGGEKGLSIDGGQIAGIYLKTNGGNVSLSIEDGVTVSGKIGVAFYGSPLNTKKVYTGEKTLNIKGGSISGAEAGVFAQGSATKNTDDPVVVNISGGTITGGYYAVAGNGTDGYNGTEINISGGELKSTGSEGAGVYHPQPGTLTISGGSITGAVGVQMCAGDLTVTSGATITGTGIDATASKTGDGSITDGAAVSIVDRSYPGGVPTAKISGGTFKSNDGVAVVRAYGWSNNAVTDFDNTEGKVAVSGGTYSSDPSEYVAADYVAVKGSDGKYVVATAPKEEDKKTDEGNNSGSTTAAGVEVDNSSEMAEKAVATAAAVKDVEVTSTSETATINGTTVSLTSDQAADLVQVKAAASQTGAAVDVNLVVKADTNVDTDSKIAEEAPAAATVIPFDLSVDMVTTVKNDGSTVASATVPVVKTASPLKVTIAVDKDSIADSRVSVARNHSGEVTILDAAVDYDNGKITFETDQFSSYAVMVISNTQSLADYTNADGSRKAVSATDFGLSSDYVFAGWYKDKDLEDAYLPTEKSGAAYPAFVKVSELITFKGGSLRMDGNVPGEYTNLRFGYETRVPDGATRGDWYWTYSADGIEPTRVDVKNYVLNEDGSAKANLVLTEIHAKNYTTKISVAETICYQTADGTNVTATAEDNVRSVIQVAKMIKSHGMASSTEKEYADKIIDAHD